MLSNPTLHKETQFLPMHVAVMALTYEDTHMDDLFHHNLLSIPHTGLPLDMWSLL